MMVRATIDPVSGNGTQSGAIEGGPFGRLIEIGRSNDEWLAQLPGLGAALARARGYADDPASNPKFASALIGHAREKYARALAGLRANRSEAIRILAGCDAAGRPGRPTH